MHLNILRIAISTIVIAMATYLTSVFIGNETIEDAVKRIAGSEKTLQDYQFYNESIHSSSQLAIAYKKRDYKPFWFENNVLSAQAQELLKAVTYAEYESLQTKDYHIKAIEEIVNNPKKAKNTLPDSLAKIDILLTDAFVTLTVHLYAGTIIGNGMNVNRLQHLKKLNIYAILDSAITNKNVLPVLVSFSNPSPAYQLLKHNLKYYKFIRANDSFPVLPDDLVLNVGDTSAMVPLLCKRLQLTNELKAFYSNTIYDTFIANAVKHFQYHHGLPETGLLTEATIAELNVPVDERIRQIELNMERWRWLPRTHPDTVIMVNIPGFSMHILEKMKPISAMRAIVGKEYTQTPVFYATMKYLVINPYWDVPYSIASKELLPQIKANPGYLSHNHMLLYNSSGSGPVNPYNVNWSHISARNFPFKIRQKPGTWNSLGDIKFIFPNPYNVYLHGTPGMSLFEKPVRAFSHGCMRLENPVKLTAYLLNNPVTWSEAKIKSVIDTRVEKTVKLPHTLPVYVCYWTCWPDEKGELHFRNDVYGHDDLLANVFYTNKTEAISQR